MDGIPQPRVHPTITNTLDEASSKTPSDRDLRVVLSKNCESAALTTDVQSSRATQAYNTVNLHFINKEWELCSFVLDTSLFPGSHTGQNIADKVQSCLPKFNIAEETVVACVHDKAVNAMAAGRILHDLLGQKNQAYAAHVLQTAVCPCSPRSL